MPLQSTIAPADTARAKRVLRQLGAVGEAMAKENTRHSARRAILAAQRDALYLEGSSLGFLASDLGRAYGHSGTSARQTLAKAKAAAKKR